MTMQARQRPDWGNLELDLGPIPPNTPQQRRAAQLAACRWAPDATVAGELLDMLGLRERIDA